MFPILQIGSLAIQMPGLLLLSGLWLGLSLAEREAKRLQQDPDQISYLAYLGIVAGLLAGRLAYVARYPGAYAADPLSVLSLTAATWAPLEGVLVALGAMGWYLAQRRLNVRLTFEAYTPLAIVLVAAFGLAHLATGDAFGAPARLPWSIYLWEEYRHPSQVYEVLVALGLGVVWWRLRSQGGLTFWIVLTLWAAVSLFLETFRGESFLVSGFRVAQFFYLAMFVASFGLARRWARPA